MNTAGLAKSLVLLALVLVGGAVGTFAVSSSLDDADRPVAHEDSFAVDYDATYELETREQFVSISVETGGTTLERGTDYTFEESSGALEFEDTTATTEGDVATVSWTYQGNGAASDTTEDLQVLLVSLLPYLGFIPVALFLMTLTAGIYAYSTSGGFSSGGMSR